MEYEAGEVTSGISPARGLRRSPNCRSVIAPDPGSDCRRPAGLHRGGVPFTGRVQYESHGRQRVVFVNGNLLNIIKLVSRSIHSVHILT